MTPLHKVFQTNDFHIICKCLIGSVKPNLNMVDERGNTPLAYCSRKMLERLNLQSGVVCVATCRNPKFDNNTLLEVDKFESLREEDL